jgi:hypothetical protein
MSFTRAKGAGWLNGELLTQAEINQIDENQSKAVDGDAGGPYAPSADITFAGATSIQWGASRYPKLSSRTIKRVQPLIVVGPTTFLAAGDFSNGNLAHLPTQDYVDVSGSNVPRCTFSLSNLIDMATLTAVTIHVDPATEPATRSKITLLKHLASGTAVGAEKTDDYGGTYTDPHSYSITGLSEAIDQSSSEANYSLLLRGETGAGATAGLTIDAIVLTFTVTLATPG